MLRRQDEDESLHSIGMSLTMERVYKHASSAPTLLQHLQREEHQKAAMSFSWRELPLQELYTAHGVFDQA